jgi:hypothetical protein
MPADPPVFDSSDSARHSRPLRYAQSVTFNEPLALEEGGTLPGVTVAQHVTAERAGYYPGPVFPQDPP